MIRSLSSSGMSGGSLVKLMESPKVLCCSAVGLLSNKDGFIGWSDGNGNPWSRSGVPGMGVDVVDRQLGSGVRRGWYTGDVGL